MVAPDGHLTLIAGLAATTGGAPLDLALGAGAHTLYMLNARMHTIQMAAVGARARLGTPAAVATVLASPSGLIAR